MVARLCEIILKPYAIFPNFIAEQSVDSSSHVDDVVKGTRLGGSCAVLHKSFKI